MKKKYILALDQGTTSSRAILFDQQGSPQGMAQQEFRQFFPHSGWVEHDATEIWRSQLQVMHQAIANAGASPGDIAAVGVTNQRETCLLWDRHTGQPIHPAIVWQDRRTAGFCKQMKEEGAESEFRQKTGLLLDPYFSGTKIRWLLENIKGARKAAERSDLLFGTMDTWLIWNLTAGRVHVTDVTNASRTLLFNIHDLQWDEELLDRLDIPPAILPEVKPSSEIYGQVDENILSGSIPIGGAAGDQHAAMFGQACFQPGMAKNTYGTGCFLLMNTGDQPVASNHGLLTTVAWQVAGKTEYALEGSVFIGGAVVQWLRDELRLIESAAECDRIAATVEDSNGVFLVPAFTGLGAPHWDPFARGAMVGLTRGTNRAHLCRAALESIAFQSAELLTSMENDAGFSLTELRVDGGASRSDLLMQFQSDLLQTQVIRPECIETTALGAAYLAGLAVGYWSSPDDISANWNESKRYQPQRPAEAMEPLMAGWKRAVDRAKSWSE